MAKKQFGVIGLGTFGSNVAKELFKRNFPVLAIDHKEEVVNYCKETFQHSCNAARVPADSFFCLVLLV